MKVMEPVEGFIEEDESDDEGFIDPSFDPNNAEASVGPLPNDRRMSTSTQEAVYIYQASARAADKIHDAHIKNLGQTEALPSGPQSRDHWKKSKKQPLLPPTPDDYNMGAIAIVEEDMRNKTRMGRQSLQIQPQPEPKFLLEYRQKKEKERLTQNGNNSLWIWEHEEKKSLTPSDRTSLEVTKRPDSSKSKNSQLSSSNSQHSQTEGAKTKKRNSL